MTNKGKRTVERQSSIEMDADLGKEVSFVDASINEGKEQNDVDTDPQTFVIDMKLFKLPIYKPLLPIKSVMFFWYGSGAFVTAFLTTFFKQKGVTLNELSTTLTLSPVAQGLASVFLGLLSDKLGRSKPVLVGSLLLTMASVGCLIALPGLEEESCESQPINLKCHPNHFDRLITKTTCGVVEDTIEVGSCNVQCPENVTEYCDGQNLICEILARDEVVKNFSLSIHISGSYKSRDRCFYNVSSLSHRNSTYSWCNVPHKMYCRIACLVTSGVKCPGGDGSRTLYMYLHMALYIAFMVTFSNCYRFIDVAAMFLVTEHKADYGQQRMFGIIGMVVISPIAGLLVDATTDGTGRNYSSAFYFYIAIVFLVLGLTYKLQVTLVPPGQEMLSKLTKLAKEVEVLVFLLVVFVAGTCWCFMKHYLFWFLAELSAPGLLISLLPAVGALYGIPFLATASWWVRKIGPSHVFVLALLCYVISFTGYSFLIDPWYSLVLEVANIFNYHLLWVAVVVHSHDVAPEGLKATIISLAGTFHYHLGKVSASTIGVYLVNSFGFRIAFRVTAISCVLFAVLYALFLYVRRTCFSVKLDSLEIDVTQNSTEVKDIIKDISKIKTDDKGTELKSLG